MKTKQSNKSCNEKQIFDLITKRCLLVGGKTFNDRLKEEMDNNVIHFSLEDLIKHGYKKAKPSISKPSISKPSISKPSISKPSISKPSISKPSISKPSISKPTIVVKPLFNENASNRVEDKRMEHFYIDQEHKDFCNEKEVFLNKAVVVKERVFDFTSIDTPLLGKFKMEMLDSVFDTNKFTIKSFYKNRVRTTFTNYDRKVPVVEYDTHLFDIQWFNKMNKYMNESLSHEQLFALYGISTFNNDKQFNVLFMNMSNFATFRKSHQSKKDNYLKDMYFVLFFPLLKIVKQNIDSLDKIFENGNSKELKNLIIKNKTIILSDFKNNKHKHTLYTMIVKIAHCLTYDVIQRSVTDFKSSIEAAILGSPPTTKKMVLYKDGLSKDSFNKSTGFIKGTLDKSNIIDALNNASNDNSICVLTLMPGTKSLWLDGLTSDSNDKHMFILGLNTIYEIQKQKEFMNFHSGHVDICSDYNKTLLEIEKLTVTQK
uniref:Uncharacterized protein n=1 Tax=Pyramimonas orientalis virus TaxID=455367 RepID=A0A7L9AYP8_POV01|nr:hypothetical protein HWQ62_00233 [Pyramimonas orientalis virus]